MVDEALQPHTRLRAALMPLRRRKGIAHRHVKTIFEQNDADPRLRTERGEGHDFRDCNSQNFCDLCGQVIWGIFKPGLRCRNCKVTCHTRCREAIQLDCQHQEEQTSFGDQQEHPPKGDGKPARMECQTLTREEIEQKIKVYNSQVNNKFGMELLPDGGFTGFIKVQMHLQRPVSVAGAVGTAVSSPSLNDTGQRTTFYLPRGTEKQVHLSNLNMAGEVISALLHKFHVLDNPRKFALFQCSGPASCITKRKLEDEENPLHLRLLAGPDMTATRFVLQENETGEVIWDAFTIPELHNFLLILEREEKTYVQKVQEKYSSFQEKLQEALATRKPG